MSHLPTERFAELVDESPTAAELAHLASCADCTRERAMFQNLADLAASEATRIGSPLTTWESLAPALLADGVIDDGRVRRLGARYTRRPWLQAAAAVLFIAGGVMAGRKSAGASLLPMSGGSRPVASLIDTTARFSSTAEARQAQAQSQALYETATAFLAQQDTSSRSADSPTAIRTRLAAIEQTQDVMGEALKKAPYDAVINGYYLSAAGQREAALRQLNSVMPASMKITSY